MKGYEVRFNLYAENQEEADEASKAIKEFIDENAMNGRAVSAMKVVNAISKWKVNPFVYGRIVEYFS